QHTEETATGQLRSFRFRVDNPPISTMETVGAIRGEELALETHANGKVDTKTSKWDPDTRSPAWQDRDLQEHPLQPGETRSFEMYDPELNQVVTITVTENGNATTTLLDGTEIDARRIVMTHSAIPFLSLTSYMNVDGEVVKSESNILQVVTYTVDRETALREIDDQPVDLAVETLVQVKPIEQAHDRTRIVYRIKVSGGDAAAQFPNGPTQQSQRISDSEAEVTVTALAADAAPVADAETPEPRYLSATRFLDSNNPLVIRHSQSAAASDMAPAAAARAMEQYVHDTMRDRNFATGLATASEVADKLEGDCTEHAVLLAAMLRARKIPARVAVGLVYSQQHAAFAGHMWTEAWLDGRWTPLDATLGRGGIGAAHIKLADSALDEDAPTPIAAFLPMIHLLGEMEIEVVSAE
ncbi:MAG: transglutaminase domain-containing protein, partial [Planctomycetaceae bacterium]|nr:transglutaminase domain-containing protein [Planctomycetaceae bacterium]